MENLESISGYLVRNSVVSTWTLIVVAVVMGVFIVRSLAYREGLDYIVESD